MTFLEILLLAVALAMQQQEFVLADERLSLTAEQADQLAAHLKTLTDQIAAQTKALAEKDSRIADLEKQLAQKPADETAQVINETGKPTGLTPEAEFAQNLHNAQELYNQLP